MGAHLPGGPLGAHSPGTGGGAGGARAGPRGTGDSACLYRAGERQLPVSRELPRRQKGHRTTSDPNNPTLPAGPTPAQAAAGRSRSAPGGKASGPTCKKPCAFFPSDSRSVGSLTRTWASCSPGKPRPEAPQGGPLRAGLHPGRGPWAAHASPATEHRFPARAGLCLLTGSHPRCPAVGLPLLPQGL